jgi:phage-related minor tail protein
VADGDVSLRYKLLGEDAGASRAMDKVGKSAEHLHKTMTAVGIALGTVAVGGVLAFGAALFKGVKDAESYQTLQLKTQAVLKSTGDVAGTSVKQIQDLAGSLESLSGVDEELIINSQNVLLTFTGIRNEAGKGNDIFTQGTKAALDLSVALGTDLQGATIQVGKALNDPIKGITALQRVGVSFTAAQKDQVAAMVKAGDTMGAQKLILGELTKEFGGAAKAAGSGFSGSMARVQDAVGDAFRSVGQKLLPKLTSLTDWLADKGIPKVVEFGTTIGEKLSGWISAGRGGDQGQLPEDRLGSHPGLR